MRKRKIFIKIQLTVFVAWHRQVPTGHVKPGQQIDGASQGVGGSLEALFFFFFLRGTFRYIYLPSYASASKAVMAVCETESDPKLTSEAESPLQHALAFAYFCTMKKQTWLPPTRGLVPLKITTLCS